MRYVTNWLPRIRDRRFRSRAARAAATAASSADQYRWRVSLHEVGHSFVGRYYGLPCGHALVDTARAIPGHAHFGDDGSHRFGHICACLAGCASEVAFFGDHMGGGTDATRVAELLGAEVDVMPYWQTTLDLVSRHRDKIRHAATHLLARGRLSRRELDEFCRVEPRR